MLGTHQSPSHALTIVHGSARYEKRLFVRMDKTVDVELMQCVKSLDRPWIVDFRITLTTPSDIHDNLNAWGSKFSTLGVIGNIKRNIKPKGARFIPGNFAI